MSGVAVSVAYGRLVQAEVDDQLGQLGPNPTSRRLRVAAEGVVSAAHQHELEPDDPTFWNAVADALRDIAARRDRPSVNLGGMGVADD